MRLDDLKTGTNTRRVRIFLAEKGLKRGAGVVDDAGESGLAVGSRVMFTEPYGVGENGAWQDWLLVRPEHLALAPDAIDWRPLGERNQ